MATRPLYRVEQYQREHQAQFYAFLDAPPEAKEKLRAPLYKSCFGPTGTYQWCDKSYNIIAKEGNCRNDCRYCYMKRIKSRFFNTDVEDLTMEVMPSRVDKKWRATTPPKVIMFPSAHDIFPEFVDDFVSACINICKANHKVLIVTKPMRAVVLRLIEKLAPYRAQLIFRLTISTSDPAILAYWEPNAPTFAERRECLALLHQANFETSVSMEPYLSDPRDVVANVDADTTETIWIGEMSGISQVDATPAEIERVKTLYAREYVEQLVRDLRPNPKVFWKTSVIKLLTKA